MPTKYRVNTFIDNKEGYQEFATKDEVCIALHQAHGVGEIETIVEDEPVDAIDCAALHTAIYNAIWRRLNYIGLWEINHAAANAQCSYNDEAIALIAYYWATWQALEGSEVTTQEALAQVMLSHSNEHIPEAYINEAMQAL